MQDQIFNLIKLEQKRQNDYLEMIPSENYASKAVMKAVGSCLMNKYAEGQVGKRYYQGNEVVDQVEKLTKERILKVFGLDREEWGVNVQPHSGCEANLAVYNALLNPGDRILSMYLPDGGHLSHGWQIGDRKVTLISKIFDVEFYKTDTKTKVFNYQKIKNQAEIFKPKMIVSGGTAYPRDIDHQAMAKTARAVGAYYLADISHEAGLIAAGLLSSPFTYADVVTFTTHKTLRGPRGAVIISRKKKIDTAVSSGFKISGLKQNQTIAGEIDSSVFPGLQGGPHLHTIAGIGVALGEIMTPEFKRHARQVVKNAQVLANGLMKSGFDVVSGGTDKHLVLIDLRNMNLSGWTVAWALETAGIVANRNTVPAETASPFYPSGLRLGTPAITTRGMKEKEMKQIVDWIKEVVDEIKAHWKNGSKAGKNGKGDPIVESKKAREEFLSWIVTSKELIKIKSEVKKLCREFPVEV